jgi:hypothetical protein
MQVAEVGRAGGSRTRGSVSGPAVSLVEPDGTSVPFPNLYLADGVLRRRITYVDHLSRLCHKTRDYGST